MILPSERLLCDFCTLRFLGPSDTCVKGIDYPILTDPSQDCDCFEFDSPTRG